MTNFTNHTTETAPESAKETLANIEGKYGFVPNLFSYMAEAPTTIDAYLQLNELVTKTSLTPSQQQVALLTASVVNECEFCIAAHRAFGKAFQVDPKTIDAIVNKTQADNPSDRALIKLTKSMVINRGKLTTAELEEFLDAGFTKQQVFEVVLMVTIKTLSNYINHLTSPEPNKELLAMI